MGVANAGRMTQDEIEVPAAGLCLADMLQLRTMIPRTPLALLTISLTIPLLAQPGPDPRAGSGTANVQ